MQSEHLLVFVVLVAASPWLGTCWLFGDFSLARLGLSAASILLALAFAWMVSGPGAVRTPITWGLPALAAFIVPPVYVCWGPPVAHPLFLVGDALIEAPIVSAFAALPFVMALHSSRPVGGVLAVAVGVLVVGLGVLATKTGLV